MKIGIDIDDTITNFSDVYYSGLQKWCLEKNIISSNSCCICSN